MNTIEHSDFEADGGPGLPRVGVLTGSDDIRHRVTDGSERTGGAGVNDCIRMINMLEPSPEVLQALAKEASRVTLGADDTRKLPVDLAREGRLVLVLSPDPTNLTGRHAHIGSRGGGRCTNILQHFRGRPPFAPQAHECRCRLFSAKPFKHNRSTSLSNSFNSITGCASFYQKTLRRR